MKQIFIIGSVFVIAFFLGTRKREKSEANPLIEEVVVEKIVRVPIPNTMEWFYGVSEPPSKEVVVEPTVVEPTVDWDIIMLNGVKYFEGFYPKKYYCSAGKLTIGYGSSNQTLLNKGFVSRAEAERVLRMELKKVQELVRREVLVKLDANQLNSLTSFTFNCGLVNLKQLINGKGRLNDGNYDSIVKYMPMYRLSAGKVKLGLERRRAWEVSVWQGKVIEVATIKKH